MNDARPLLHFTPPAGWMNDPNGLVYLNGEYHLFYQHRPDAIVHGPMHWGHAVSRDLLNWSDLPIALEPDSAGWVFSGCAVVDHGNTSGFGDGLSVPLVAIFTCHDPIAREAGLGGHESQCLAYSLDCGRTWQRYVSNPVLAAPQGVNDFRDPKVFWHDESKAWVMALAVADRITFYRSEDLKNWSALSEFGSGVGADRGVWECPDLFPISVEGEERAAWILLVSINPGGPHGGSGTQYFVGDFDGTQFVPKSTHLCQIDREGPSWVDVGPDNYAGVTFSNRPAEQAHPILIGWMSNWLYGQTVPAHGGWRGAMTLPRKLRLSRNGSDWRLIQEPVLPRSTPAVGVSSQRQIDLPDGAFELAMSIVTGDGAGTFNLRLCGSKRDLFSLTFDRRLQRFVVLRPPVGDTASGYAGTFRAKRTRTDPTLKLRVIVDRHSVEIFADEGECVMTFSNFPLEAYAEALIHTTGSGWNVTRINLARYETREGS